MNGNAAERSEIGVQRVALLSEHDTGERTGEYDMSWLQRVSMRTDLVREPGDAKRRMARVAAADMIRRLSESSIHVAGEVNQCHP